MDAKVSAPTPDTTTISPVGLAVPPEGHRIGLSPIARRRVRLSSIRVMACA